MQQINNYNIKELIVMFLMKQAQMRRRPSIGGNTRPGVSKVKPKVWFKYSIYIDCSAGLFHHVFIYIRVAQYKKGL